MGKVMEAVFCVFYLIFTCVIGILTLKRGKGREARVYGSMTLVLVFGDAFHLVPRVLAVIAPNGDFHAAAGIGKMITSITMTLFYVMLYRAYELRYGKRSKGAEAVIGLLALVRIALCLLPQNDWTGAAPVIWGIYRNIPFTVMGAMIAAMFFGKRGDARFRNMWIAIVLSFAFYIPVVLWADRSPMIGMLMLPKTCMYMWMAVMGYRAALDGKA